MGSRIAWCLVVVSVCAIAGAAKAAEPKKLNRDASSLVIVLGGDLGLGGSGQPINSNGGYRHGKLISWKKLTNGIAPLLNGDVNFGNLESVVTNKRKLSPVDKLFTFQMHANGARHLVDVGFNVFSIANNHSRDFGQLGMRQTLRHLKRLRQNGLLAAPGLGAGRRAALAPSLIKVKGAAIAVSALGIGGTQPGRHNRRIGQASYSSIVDFGEILTALAGAKADYKILSAHYGRELSIRPSASAVRKLRDQAVAKHGTDLVVGHHAHVASGIQRIGRRLILYGLGNLLHLGMQDMAKFGHCRDFGLIVRLHLERDADKGLKAAAIEAIPLTRMHAAARAMSPVAAGKRIAVLNGLANELDHQPSGAVGVRFKVNREGHGVYCFVDGESEKRAVHPLCRDRQMPLRDVGAVRCSRLSKTILARSSRNRLDRKKIIRKRRRTVRSSTQNKKNLTSRIFGSVYAN